MHPTVGIFEFLLWFKNNEDESGKETFIKELFLIFNFITSWI